MGLIGILLCFGLIGHSKLLFFPEIMQCFALRCGICGYNGLMRWRMSPSSVYSIYFFQEVAIFKREGIGIAVADLERGAGGKRCLLFAKYLFN
jgi:hypothetical protein